jgi:L-2-hydroxycarboxylate dehydrogenase (NAD+)
MKNIAHILVNHEALIDFCIQILIQHGVLNADAEIVADVLVTADLRGIESHGVASLARYIDDIKKGIAIPKPHTKIIYETPVTLLLDGGAGLGHPNAHRAMLIAVEKAVQMGAGFVSVRNSNHFGIAGYYAMLALDRDCIGIALTNSISAVVPTFGVKAMLGTNPIALAAPTHHEQPFVLDMATSVVAAGRIGIYKQRNQSIPPNWSIDESANSITDSEYLSHLLLERKAGGLLPLGGLGENAGGHKGFGLGLMVETMCGILSGSAYADLLYPQANDGHALPSGIGQFFGAWKINCFRPEADFKDAMDDLLRRIRNSPKVPSKNRIYTPGEKEYEALEQRSQIGIPVPMPVIDKLRSLAEEVGVTFTI